MSTEPRVPSLSRPPRWRRAARTVLWVLVAGWAAFTLLRLLGLELVWPVVAALAYTPYVTLGLLVPAALAMVLRAWRPLLAVAACAVVLSAVVVPRALPAAPPPATGPQLRVMTVNLYGGSGDAQAVVSLVRRHQVDVLTVLELTTAGAGELAAAGIDGLLPHQEVRAGDTVEGSGIYAGFPLSPAPGLEVDSQYAMPAVRVAVPGAHPVELMAIHPVPPVLGEVSRWRRELAALPPAAPDGTVRVLAGDFNATLDHAALRGLIATGYTDAGDAAGAGLVGTWRVRQGPASVFPPVPLDRVLVDSRVAVGEVSVHPVPGSDHRSVIAELTLPGPPPG